MTSVGASLPRHTKGPRVYRKRKADIVSSDDSPSPSPNPNHSKLSVGDQTVGDDATIGEIQPAVVVDPSSQSAEAPAPPFVPDAILLNPVTVPSSQPGQTKPAAVTSSTPTVAIMKAKFLFSSGREYI